MKIKESIENILQKYFNCKKPFLKNPYYDEQELFSVTMTKNGSKNYGKLISLLYSIGNITQINVNNIVDKLDSIVSEL